MQRILREGLSYLLAMALVVLVTSAACFWLLRSSYAGVSDDTVAERGLTAHGAYIGLVAQAASRVLVAEVVCLTVLTGGLLALRRRRPRGAEPTSVAKALPIRVMVAAVVFFAWLGAQARRHPGLFLPLLSANMAGPVWVTLAGLLWPAILALSIAGWVKIVVSSRSTSARCIGLAGTLFSIAWFWTLEIGPSVAGAGKHETERSVPTSPLGSRPNILFVAVDSLRPDAIDEKATPTLARLLSESIYFPNTLVTLPRTAPSWVALLTSLPPLANGVETMFPSAARARLANIAMPAHLASLGYATSVGSEYAGEFFDRVELGFNRRSVPRVELKEIMGQALLGREPPALALAGELYAGPRWLGPMIPNPLSGLLRGFASFSCPSVLGRELAKDIEAGHPWFAVLFYSQPHFPYTSSAPFSERYTVVGSNPSLRFGKDVTRGDVRTAEDRAQIRGLYRAALAETDAAVRELLERLESSGELDDTIVVLTADHGEGLYECPACVGHGDSLAGMMSLKVPLAFRLPPRRYPRAVPATIGTYVSQLDVYPTILRLLGVPSLPIHEGLPLLASDGSFVPLPSERIFFAETGEWLWPTPAVPADRLDYPPITSLAVTEGERIVIDDRFLPIVRAAKHRAAIRPPFKLVYRPTRAGVVWSLYDVDHDPFDTNDIAAEHPDELAELRAALERSVLRYAHMTSSGDFFLTRPTPPREEYY